jgi:hypothetical protein
MTNLLKRAALAAGVLITLIPTATAVAVPPREGDPSPEEPPGEVTPAPVEYGFMAVKQGLDGCPTRLVRIEEDGTYVYEADCPRSTSTEVPPRNVGLSPAAGKDWNKTADIVAKRIENYLADKERQEAHCKTAGPAAGRTYEEVIYTLHAMTDAIRRDKETMGTRLATLQRTLGEADGLREEARRIRSRLAARPNPRLPGEEDVLTAAERAELERRLDATLVQLRDRRSRLDAETNQLNEVVDEVNRRIAERDKLMDDANKRKEVNGRFCGP